jgi:hypothetical protein
MRSQIEVWHDDASDPDEPFWCVSLCDGDGQEIECLFIYDDKNDALEAGREAARERGLRLCARSEHGTVAEVASADTMRMQAMLMRRGDRFSGDNPEEEAEKWVDQGFGVDEADDWCEVGVWDAAVAAELRDAGLTPERAKAAAESLTDGLDDPAEEYTDGDPIYAACNGDIKANVIIDAARMIQ